MALFTFALAVEAQVPLGQWDGSGNGQLSGVYNFRQVFWELDGSNRADLNSALAIFGTMNFNGTGGYTIACRFLDSSAGRVQACPALSGTYRVSAGGIARLSSDLGSLEGLITNGVLVASATESDYNDFFIAAKAADNPGTGILNGRYWVGHFDVVDGNVNNYRDSLFQAAFDGAGGIDTATATGYIGTNGASPVTQSISGARYSFSSGIGTLAIGGTLSTTNLIAGSKEFYVSPDGNLFFGGSINAWDMVIGIRAPSNPAAASLTSGLYYQAAVKSVQSGLAQGVTRFETYYGSVLKNGSFQAGHQRLQDLSVDRTYDNHFTSAYTVAPEGTYEDTGNGMKYAASSDGKLELGIGKGPVLGIALGARADFSGNGVFVHPGIIYNAASFVPSTAGVSRGELVTLFGSGLANSTLFDGSYPTTLGGVLVLINGRPAPILRVSPTEIVVQIPFSLVESSATFTVINNGQTSTPVMLYVRPAAPGVFLKGSNYRAAALHLDYTEVTNDKPAGVGEIIQIYVTGFGDVTPAVNAGVPAPVDPLSKISVPVFAALDNLPATVQYQGLAPGLIGLYQLNITVPTGVHSGDVPLILATADAVLVSAVIPIAAP